MVRGKPSTRLAHSPSATAVGVPRVPPLDQREPKPFNVQKFLDSAGVARRIVEYGRADVIFRQGDPCDSVLYLQAGGVTISVLSKTGRQAVVAMLGPGDFFGEGGLAGQPRRVGSATATDHTTVLIVDQQEMVRMLHEQPAMSDRLMAYLLARTIRVEEELIDQLFNSSEKRLARKLLLLARYGDPNSPIRTVPALSQETLAEMVGTTRSRVNFFLKKFERLGFVTRKNGLRVNNSLLTVALHD
jgi:CRP/FNR family cyclic AMP-dependent transcriptional regulator